MLLGLLQDNMNLLSTIEVYHRKTLKKDYNLHELLGEIKDSMFEYNDKLGEYIIKNNELLAITRIDVSAFEDDCEDICNDSFKKLQIYISRLMVALSLEQDLRIQNYLIEIADELEQYAAKLESW